MSDLETKKLRKTSFGDRTVSLPVALLIFLGVITALAGVGSAVGYRYFWGGGVATQLDAERARWEAETKRTPSDPVAWTELGIVLHKRGDLGGAEKALQAALNLESQADRARYFLGMVYIDEGKYPEAEAAFREILKRDIGNPLIFYQLARVEMGREDYKKAQEHLDYIIEYIDPALTEVHYLRGEALEKSGNKVEGIEAYKKAANLDPNYQPARDSLQRLGIKPPQVEDVIWPGEPHRGQQ